MTLFDSTPPAPSPVSSPYPPGRTSKIGLPPPWQVVQCWRQESRGRRVSRPPPSITHAAPLLPPPPEPPGDDAQAPLMVSGLVIVRGKSHSPKVPPPPLLPLLVRLRYRVMCATPLRTAPTSCRQLLTKQLPRLASPVVTHVKEAPANPGGVSTRGEFWFCCESGPLIANTSDAHAPCWSSVAATATSVDASARAAATARAHSWVRRVTSMAALL